MAGTTINQPLSFDPFTVSFAKQQPYSEFSPADIYSSLEEFGTDFTTDSAPSPGSPTSPVFTNSYSLPTEDWMIWDKLDAPSEHDAFAFLKTEPIGSPILASIPSARSISISPAINPMDLSNQVQDDVIFGREGISDTQALFQTPQAANFVQSPMSAMSPEIKRSPFSSPEPELTSPPKRQLAGAKRHPSRGLKRKSSSSASSPDSRRSSASPAPPLRRGCKDAKQDAACATAPKKTAHNMIEKRYRTNLNDKIAALRDAVPALRVMVHRLEHGSSGDEGEDEGVAGLGTDRRRQIKREVLDEEDLGGLAPAHKLNKATILSKATEYIAHLERRNRSLAKENAALRGRVEGFEMLVMSRGGQQRNVWG